MKRLQKLSFVGSGNVAFHLAKALTQNDVEVSHIFSRNQISAEEFSLKFDTTIVSDLNDLPESQPILICVPDDSIEAILESLKENYAVAYTSGSVNISSLPDRKNLGVFYPLQTFSKGKQLDYQSIPFLIEANNPAFAEELMHMAKLISSNVRLADSVTREKLHLSAVWVNNFTNHIVHQAQELAIKNDVDFNLLMPLLNETVSKLNTESAFKAQTGPARRGDQHTIDNQLLKLDTNQKAVYQAITESIIKTYKND